MVDRASYAALGDDPRSPDSNLSPPFPSEYESRASGGWSRVREWWSENVRSLGLLQQQEAAHTPQSGYLTLIPLSDSRLQPRSTRFTALLLLLFALTVAGSVFLVVPRTVAVGELSFHADRMSWNMTKSSYQLKLLVRLPVSNPNYFKASIEGNLQVLFYGTEAGRMQVPPVSLPARAMPKGVKVEIDASDVPADYILSILTQCSTFPEVLIFFLKGRLTAHFLWQRQHLPTIDTYFMIDCKAGNGGVVRGSGLVGMPAGPVPPRLVGLADQDGRGGGRKEGRGGAAGWEGL